MSLRYILEIKNKKYDGIQYIQIFGRNDLIKKLHEFAGIKIKEPFLDELPESFEKELNTDSLRALYKIVDDYCKDFAMQGRTFEDPFDPFDISVSFDEFVAFGSWATVFQSAQMFYWLVRCKVITRDSFDINPDYTVTFRYS